MPVSMSATPELGIAGPNGDRSLCSNFHPSHQSDSGTSPGFGRQLYSPYEDFVRGPTAFVDGRVPFLAELADWTSALAISPTCRVSTRAYAHGAYSIGFVSPKRPRRRGSRAGFIRPGGGRDC